MLDCPVKNSFQRSSVSKQVRNSYHDVFWCFTCHRSKCRDNTEQNNNNHIKSTLSTNEKHFKKKEPIIKFTVRVYAKARPHTDKYQTKLKRKILLDILSSNLRDIMFIVYLGKCFDSINIDKKKHETQSSLI